METPVVALQNPSAFALDRFSVKVLAMMANVEGVISAPPTAWNPRDVISTPSDGEREHAIEPAVNTTRPIRKQRRRPKRSLKEPDRKSRLPRTRM